MLGLLTLKLKLFEFYFGLSSLCVTLLVLTLFFSVIPSNLESLCEFTSLASLLAFVLKID